MRMVLLQYGCLGEITLKNMNLKEILISWLEAGDTPRVLSGLSVVRKRWTNKDFAFDISFQSGRYQDLQAQQAKGVISQAEYQLESAKIRQVLIEIINTFPDHWTSEGLEDIPSTKNLFSGTTWKKWPAIVTVIIIFSGLLLQFTGYPLHNIFQKNLIRQMQTTSSDTLLKPKLQINTSGDKSPAINAPGGNVEIIYRETTSAKKTNKKDSLSDK